MPADLTQHAQGHKPRPASHPKSSVSWRSTAGTRVVPPTTSTLATWLASRPASASACIGRRVGGGWGRWVSGVGGWALAGKLASAETYTAQQCWSQAGSWLLLPAEGSALPLPPPSGRAPAGGPAPAWPPPQTPGATEGLGALGRREQSMAAGHSRPPTHTGWLLRGGRQDRLALTRWPAGQAPRCSTGRAAVAHPAGVGAAPRA